MRKSTVRPDDDFGKDEGLLHEAVLTGRKAGAGREFWKTLAHNEPLFRRIVEVANGLEEISPAVKTAHDIMGDKFFGLRAGMELFGYDPTLADIRHSLEIPWTAEELRARRSTHALAFVPPSRYFRTGAQFACKSVMLDTDTSQKPEWRFVGTLPFPNSIGKPWDEQFPLLGMGNAVPSIYTVLYVALCIRMKNGGILWNGANVRCKEHAGSMRVSFEGSGDRPYITDWLDNDQDGDIGIAHEVVPNDR